MTFNGSSWQGPWFDKDIKETRLSAARTFLSTGNWTNIERQCWDSTQCGSGFSCINSKCVANTDTSSVAGECGGTTTTSGATFSGCGGGSGTGTSSCTTAGCSNDADCPGDRCCRYDAFGNVNCWCGSCPIYDGDSCSSDCQCYSGVCRNGICGEGYCTVFCDQYYKGTGKRFAGCEGGTCDECSYCGGNTCQKSPYAPCWCGGTAGCASGEICDPVSGDCSPAPDGFALCKNITKCGRPTGEVCCKQPYQWQQNPDTCPDGTLVKRPCDQNCRNYTVYFGTGDDPATWRPDCPEGCYCTIVNSIYEQGPDGPNGEITTGELIGVIVEECCEAGGDLVEECEDKMQTVPEGTPFEIPCKPKCKCTGTGFITAAGQTTHFWRECCGKECNCAKNPKTCDEQCGECKECNGGYCYSKANCPPLEPTPTLSEDTCFTGYYGTGCFTNVRFIDHDCCYFTNFRPDGDWNGVYIGGGQLRVTSCNGAYCDVPVGGIRSLSGTTAPTIISNSQSGLINCGCCNCSGTLVGFTYS